MTVKAGAVIVVCVCVCVICMDGMKGVRLEREGTVVGWVEMAGGRITKKEKSTRTKREGN